MRYATYGFVSTFLSIFILQNSYHKIGHFYKIFHSLSRSSLSLTILASTAVYYLFLIAYLLKKFFFGTLRAIEVEHLYERGWFAITETCLTITIFRDNFDPQFIILFIFLLFVKVFHWLFQDRVDFMDQNNENNRLALFYTRISLLIILLGSIDFGLFYYFKEQLIVAQGQSLIIFCFEYAILSVNLIFYTSKFILNLYESYRAIGNARENEDNLVWEKKSILIFYSEMFLDFIKLLIYSMFLFTITKLYGLPLHIIRDLYLTGKSFLQKCKDVIRSREAIRNMNERYANATQIDLDNGDNTCIICREEMRVVENNNILRDSQNTTPKKLPCGHIFHFNCLRSWIERQQTCPTCRTSLLNQQNTNINNNQNNFVNNVFTSNRRNNNQNNNQPPTQTTTLNQTQQNSIFNNNNNTNNIPNSGLIPLPPNFESLLQPQQNQNSIPTEIEQVIRNNTRSINQQLDLLKKIQDDLDQINSQIRNIKETIQSENLKNSQSVQQSTDTINQSQE